MPVYLATPPDGRGPGVVPEDCFRANLGGS